MLLTYVVHKFCSSEEFTKEFWIKISIGIILTILFYFFTFYFTYCDCTDQWGCNDDNWELHCPAFNEYCTWSDSKSECINKYCDCWTININRVVAKVCKWVGIPTTGLDIIFAILRAIGCWGIKKCWNQPGNPLREKLHDEYDEDDKY